ncbi:DNA cytosine methyltransferase [Rathayibacter sp. ZW T2_19]|uniref:Cytosine-specific methyltransferase n=1 Tax=Rathayibacter rubneri TaxID=2950106 RepID=A0A9X2DYY5_9MICO|nr:DNA cytosine methyltransferase [Rathayibacter rubneri]MCM6763238.1 DNA cytosine methyltransferase [Rathayibacter rubneri]
MTPRPIRTLDLFAGAGGLTAGFHAASPRIETVAAVEWDIAAAASFEENFGRGKAWAGSIQSWLAEADMPTDIDIVIGGPPCQGFSTLGKQDVEDERNDLWRTYAETIRRVRPKYFVVENVAAFTKSAQFLEFEAAIQPGGILEDYAFECRILNAADYGAPQARKRAVLIGHRRDLAVPGFPVPTHLGRHRTVRDALITEHRISFQTIDEQDLAPRTIEFAGKIFKGPFSGLELHTGRKYSSLSLRRFQKIPVGGNRFDLPFDLQAKCWQNHRSGSADVMGRLHWDRPAVTIRTEFFKPEKGRYLHPEAMRSISLYEAAILQGFPTDYKFVGSRTAIARQIGNAVPIPLGAAIAGHLVEAVDGRTAPSLTPVTLPARRGVSTALRGAERVQLF